jgi:RimJ/RimL family protein N-acetyltransferase
MNAPGDEESIAKQRREQMLKLVSKGFYNELINYGVREDEVLKVASHLLDNIMAHEGKPGKGIEFYNQVFTIDSVQDEWKELKRLTVHHVTLEPITPAVIPLAASWLKDPVVRESFVPAFPKTERQLGEYLTSPGNDYFTIFSNGQPVGIVGGENLDEAAGKLEMKKLVGDSQGKGVGKRATFAFLYYAFMVRDFHKVYIHSLDINIRNLNLNSRFGFEVEGIFLEDIKLAGGPRDVVRMALLKPLWAQIFARV